ncbi:DMT family transporter [Niallia sp. 01092]|uniref:DMT family transporter n=1 Tax=unclassified Niallia TaxID=2837522 RepID=UPI003FD46AB0
MKYLNLYLPLVGFAVFTGATFHLAKYTVDYFSPASAAAWRFGIAAIVMGIVLIFKEGMKKVDLQKNSIPYLLLGIIGIFGFNTLFFVGLKYTSPVNGALIMGLNPLLTSLFARVILKESITKRQMAGIILAFIGVLFVLTQGSFDTIRNLSFSIGDIIIMGGNICWALYGVLGRRFIKGATSLASTTYSMIFGAVCLMIFSLFTPNPVPLTDIPFQAWGSIIFMAIFTSVLGYLWWNKGIKTIGANKTSLFFNLVPVVAMIISFAAGSPVAFSQIIGAVFVIFGVLIASGMIAVPNRDSIAFK